MCSRPRNIILILQLGSPQAHRWYTLNNIGSLEGALQYYYHAITGEPCKGSPGVAW